MKKGFTLVELSIVLVIIGLLIGGILVGQSLIDSAKLNSVVRKIQQLDIAVAQFKLKYNSIPGDTPLFAPAGNNDKFIDCGFGLDYDDPSNAEVANFMVHLNDSGFLPNLNFTSSIGPDSLDNSSQTPNLMSLGLSLKGASIVPMCPSNYTALSVSASNDFLLDNRYIITDTSQYTNIFGDWGYAALTAVEAASIDKKLDDGAAATGTVGINYSDYGCLDGSNTYDLSTSGYLCELGIKMFSQANSN